MTRNEIKYIAGLACILFALSGITSALAAQRIKTSYKHYSIFNFQDKNILCEPYIVQKDDWLYKIFKQKGEISEQDFPFFISIFKQLNPHIHNVDAIPAGARILIPLKLVSKQDYAPGPDGLVKVPVVEFQNKTARPRPEIRLREYTISPGDTVSELMDQVFLKKGGGISPEGLHHFYQLNPHIKSVHQVRPGDRIRLPDPALLRSSLRPMLFEDMAGATVSPEQIQHLHQYAATVNGTLVHQGKLYFPGRAGGKDVQLDLSRTPLIESGDLSKKTLLVQGRHPGGGHLLDEMMRQTIASYWQQFTLQSIDAAIQQLVKLKTGLDMPAGHLPGSWITDILSDTRFEYFSKETIRFEVNHVPLSVAIDLVKRPGRPDLLLNFGTVYGQGITAIQQAGFEVLSFSAQESASAQIRLLLSALGYSVWQDPAFNNKGTVETLTGIYGENPESRLFISFLPLTPGARSFLETRQIRHVFLKQ
jgi:hypothetical protein